MATKGLRSLPQEAIWRIRTNTKRRMTVFRKYSFALLLLVVLTAMAACAPAAAPATTTAPAAPTTAAPAPTTVAAKKFRVAVVLSGSIKDNGWNQGGYEAAMAIKTKYNNVDVSYQESVAAAAVNDVLHNYAADGYDLILAHDIYFTDAVNKVAPDFPKVMFGIDGGTSAKSPNVVAVSGTNWEGAYLAGVLAGLLTKANKIGILTATDSAVAKFMVTGFKNGVKLYNDKADVTHAFAGSFNDAVKGKELVKGMIANGADVIFTNAGEANVASAQAAQEAKVMYIGAVVDMSNVAPDTVVSSAIASPGAYIDLMVKWLVDGTLSQYGGKAQFLGVKAGIEDLAPYHNFDSKLSQDVKDKVKKARQDLVDGKVTPPPQ